MSAMQLHMQKRKYTDRGTELISVTGEEKLSITFTGIMTHIRKKIPSFTFTGIKTNIRKKYRQHTKENTVIYLYWDKDLHTKENTVNIRKKYCRLPLLG